MKKIAWFTILFVSLSLLLREPVRQLGVYFGSISEDGGVAGPGDFIVKFAMVAACMVYILLMMTSYASIPLLGASVAVIVKHMVHMYRKTHHKVTRYPALRAVPRYVPSSNDKRHAA